MTFALKASTVARTSTSVIPTSAVIFATVVSLSAAAKPTVFKSVSAIAASADIANFLMPEVAEDLTFTLPPKTALPSSYETDISYETDVISAYFIAFAVLSETSK